MAKKAETVYTELSGMGIHVGHRLDSSMNFADYIKGVHK